MTNLKNDDEIGIPASMAIYFFVTLVPSGILFYAWFTTVMKLENKKAENEKVEKKMDVKEKEFMSCFWVLFGTKLILEGLFPTFFKWGFIWSLINLGVIPYVLLPDFSNSEYPYEILVMPSVAKCLQLYEMISDFVPNMPFHDIKLRNPIDAVVAEDCPTKKGSGQYHKDTVKRHSQDHPLVMEERSDKNDEVEESDDSDGELPPKKSLSGSINNKVKESKEPKVSEELAKKYPVWANFIKNTSLSDSSVASEKNPSTPKHRNSDLSSEQRNLRERDEHPDNRQKSNSSGKKQNQHAHNESRHSKGSGVRKHENSNSRQRSQPFSNSRDENFEECQAAFQNWSFDSFHSADQFYTSPVNPDHFHTNPEILQQKDSNKRKYGKKNKSS